MLRTNVHCLTPSPSKRPVDIKRGKSEYVDSPLHTENLFISELRFAQGIAGDDCFQYMGPDKNVQWYNGCVKWMGTHGTTVDEPFKTTVSGVFYPTFVCREKFHYLFWGFFFFVRGVGGIAGAYGLKLLPILCNIPFSFVGQRFQEPKSVIFLGNFCGGGGGGKGERERGKRDIACAR